MPANAPAELDPIQHVSIWARNPRTSAESSPVLFFSFEIGRRDVVTLFRAISISEDCRHVLCTQANG
jgi:hypothetical protein